MHQSFLNPGSTPSHWRTLSIVLVVSLITVLRPIASMGQQACPRIMAQDSTLDNLVEPPGYKTGTLGELGNFKKVGTGPQTMILIPGLGFGADVFDELMTRWSDKYTMYAVTIPGFGGTPAPSAPANTVSFGDQTWTNGALAGVEKLIAKEHIGSAIVVGHWLVGTQLAVRLAVKHPDKIKGVILLSGTPRQYITDTTYAKYYETPEKRLATVDKYLAPRWFRTVTRETWDDNNFLPQDYAVHPVLGLRLWREAASPPLHVWVRYLCEFNAQELCPDLQKLQVPTLVLEPGLEGLWVEKQDYMRDTYCYGSWSGCTESNPRVTMKSIPNSRICLWLDQPEMVDASVGEFLRSIK